MGFISELSKLYSFGAANLYEGWFMQRSLRMVSMRKVYTKTDYISNVGDENRRGTQCVFISEAHFYFTETSKTLPRELIVYVEK